MIFDPSITVFTARDIVAPEYLSTILSGACRLWDCKALRVASELHSLNKVVDAAAPTLPEEVIRAWSSGAGSGGLGFHAYENEAFAGGANWSSFDSKHHGNPLNYIYLHAPQTFWQKRAEQVCRYLAETIRDLNGAIGGLHRLGDGPFWRLPGPKAGLPPLPDPVCFGPPYSQMFGIEKLLASPVFSAGVYPGNIVLLQLSDPEIMDDSVARRAKQELMRDYLGRQYFANWEKKTSYARVLTITDPRTWIPFAKKTIEDLRDYANHQKRLKSVIAPDLGADRIEQ